MKSEYDNDNPIISQPTEIGGIMVEVHGLHDVTWKEAEAYIRHIQESEKELLSHGRLTSLSVHATQSGDVLLDYAVKPPKFQRIRRITGYLVGTTDRWNNAKRAELDDRVQHSMDESEKEYSGMSR